MTFINTTLTTAIFATLCLATPVHAAGKTAAVADFSSCAKPHYPAASLAAKHTGTVTLVFLVEADGSVLEAKVKKSSGHEALDVAARDAIKLCKFVPASKDGKNIKDSVHVQYVWTL